MTTSDDPLAILAVALRSRSATVTELATAAAASEDAVVEQLHALEGRGLLRLHDGAITYRRPEDTVAEVIRQALGDAARTVDEAATRAQGLLRLLPELTPASATGHRPADDSETSLAVDIIRGPWALADMWRAVSSPTVPRSAWICVPDTEVLREAGLDYDESFWAAREGDGADVRVILSIHDTLAPINEQRLGDELAAGTHVRMHPHPPAFFWITDHDTVTLPLNWSDPAPGGAMAVRSPAIAAAMRWIFTRVWEEALPVSDDGAPWDPMLRLMASGLTMEAAARTLGLAARTGRRRVEAAMHHYGTDSHFSLGAAWGRARGETA